jgi:cytochrome P450
MAKVMAKLALAILSRSLFGIAPSPGKADAVCEAIADLSEILMGEMGQPVRLPDWLPLAAKRRKGQAVWVLNVLAEEIVGRWQPVGDSRRGTFAQLLLSGPEDRVSNTRARRSARDEILTMLHAGLETTAAALTWLWYRVANHPVVQARLIWEVDTVLGRRPPAFADVPLLAYTGRVIRETLRLHVPTWTLFPRQTVREVALGGYLLSPGSWVFIFPYALHRDPRWFADPEAFDPERFAPGGRERIPAYAYLPFGGGPHLCLGQRFALTTITLVAVTILQRFRVELAPGQGIPESEPFLALRPKGGLWLRFVRRTPPRSRSPVEECASEVSRTSRDR